MPELAEVEHSRREWDIGIGRRVVTVRVARPECRIFRDCDTIALQEGLSGRTLLASETCGKQMLFRFSGGGWIGVHLGMRGELRTERLGRKATFAPRKHDYLVLQMNGGVVLAFEDKRVFGRVRFHRGAEPPDWWTALPPSVLSPEFTASATARFLRHRGKAAIKATLLMQEHFHGIGNWMADEILWRAGLHPSVRCAALSDGEIDKLHRKTRWVSRTAMRIISDDWTYPATWLFLHRWEPGGTCPRCRTALNRATIGGRTTAWCPQCQPARDN